MNRDLVLRIYDEELRRNAPFFDAQVRLERDAAVVRLIGATADAGNNCVLYSALADKDAGAIISREIAYFTALGHSFEWRYYDYDQPADLPQLLRDRGFIPSEPEQILAIELATWTDHSELPPGYTVRRLPKHESLAAVQTVQEAVWPDFRHDWLLQSMQRERNAQPDSIDFYLICFDSQPVGAGWVRYNGRFASMFGGSTLAAHRGRGLYRALLAVRIRDAIPHGAEYAAVDAGPMSRPILSRLGFVALTGTTPFLFNCPTV